MSPVPTILKLPTNTELSNPVILEILTLLPSTLNTFV